jgi:hypothetical protein
MNTYIFTIDTEEGFKAVVHFAYTLIEATQKMLDFEGIREFNILGVVIKAA